MHLNLVIRAADPAAAAAALRALGIDLEDPNRPNPGRWHALGGASLSVEACAADEEPSVALGLGDLAGRTAPLGDAVTAAADGETATLDAGGAAVALRRHDGPVRRPSGDEGLLLHAELTLRAARSELAGAFAALGVGTALLAGPKLLTGRYGTEFALIVEGGGPDAVATLDRILAAHADPVVTIATRELGSLDPETRERVLRLAWDVVA